MRSVVYVDVINGLIDGFYNPDSHPEERMPEFIESLNRRHAGSSFVACEVVANPNDPRLGNFCAQSTYRDSCPGYDDIDEDILRAVWARLRGRLSDKFDEQQLRKNHRRIVDLAQSLVRMSEEQLEEQLAAMSQNDG